MKRESFTTAAAVIVLLTCGCIHSASAPLPSWAITAPEANAGALIAGANAAVTGYEQDQRDCATTPKLTKCPGVANPTLHTTMQDMQKALVIAIPAYTSWSIALKANPAAVQSANLTAALSTIQTTLAQLPSLTK